ncbi:unnamed protein product [Rhizophagus irregularis]|nr:unnamed protein product [Rhizophagus irregularis]
MQTSHHEERDALNWLDRTYPLTSPALEPERGKDNPVPVQDNQLLNEFFEAYKKYKAYTLLSGPDLHKVEMEKGFHRGLNQELRNEFTNKESSDPFKRLSEILVKLDVPYYLRLQILFG